MIGKNRLYLHRCNDWCICALQFSDPRQRKNHHRRIAFCNDQNLSLFGKFMNWNQSKKMFLLQQHSRERKKSGKKVNSSSSNSISNRKSATEKGTMKNKLESTFDETVCIRVVRKHFYEKKMGKFTRRCTRTMGKNEKKKIGKTMEFISFGRWENGGRRLKAKFSAPSILFL